MIETTKDIKNETNKKETNSVRRLVTKIDGNSILSKIVTQPDSKRNLVSVINNRSSPQGIPENSPVYTGQAVDISAHPDGDPVKKPNPDELHHGLWSGEAIDFTKEVDKDSEKQIQHVNKNGGKMDKLIKEYNKANEGHYGARVPMNADDTKEKMKDFYARNNEIVLNAGRNLDSSLNNKPTTPVAERPKKVTKVSASERDKESPVNKAGSSMKLGLSSSAGSESSSESQAQTWTQVGTSAGSSTGTDAGSEEGDDEEEEEDEDSEWDNDEEPEFEEYDRPQGLGLWSDSETGTGVGVGVSIGASADAGSDADSESEIGKGIGSQDSSPGFGFRNGFQMGMNGGSQSGSETMTETSVSINTESSSQSESESKADSESKANPGSKSKSRYKWKMGPSTNTGLVGTPAVMPKNGANNEKQGTGIKNAGGFQSSEGKFSKPSNVELLPVPVKQNVKEKAKFLPQPQLGIQTQSNVNTKVQASVSAQSQSGTGGGSSTKLKTRPKSKAQINMEKEQARLQEQMKKFEQDLKDKTRNNPLHRWKLWGKVPQHGSFHEWKVFGQTPLQPRLDAILEHTRNINEGMKQRKNNNYNNANKNNGSIGRNGTKDPNMVEASVDIQYEGKNTKGVSIDAGVSATTGEKEKRPKKYESKDRKGSNVHKGSRHLRNRYKWYERYPFYIPSVAEINKKLNSMPYASYQIEMRKRGRRTV